MSRRIQENTTTTTVSKVQKPTNYSEQIVRIGHRGDTKEYVTKKYQQPTRVVQTETKYDPKTGASQRIISTSFQPEAKIVTETRRLGAPTETTTTTTKYQPPTTSTQVTETRRKYGPTSSTQQTTTTTKTTQVTETRRKYGPTSTAQTTTTTTSKYQPASTSTQVTETRRKYGPLSSSTKETTTTTTTTKYQPSTTTQVTESRRKYEPVSASTNQTTSLRSKYANLQPSTQGDTKIKIGPSSNTQKEDFVTVPLKVTEVKTRYGPDSKTSKQVTYTTYQPGRAKPITDNYVDEDNDVFVVSEKRSEKYVNDNGKEKKEVTVETTTADGTKKREYRRFYAGKK
jgi:hypothetical protein